MSFIGKNIRKIRSIKSLSQAGFAELFGIKRANIGAYEEGRAQPKIDLTQKIAKYFSIPLEKFLNKELTVNDIYNFDPFRDDLLMGSLPAASVSDEKTLRLVNNDQQLAYAKHYNDEQFLSSLPGFNLPTSIFPGDRVFELTDDHPELKEAGFHAGDLLFCQAISIDGPYSIAEGQLFVVVSKDGLKSGWLYQKDLELELQPGDQPISRLDVLELWEVKGIYTQNFTTVSPLERRVKALEQELQNLRKQSGEL